MKNHSLYLVLLYAVGLLACSEGARPVADAAGTELSATGQITYQNPVLPGDFADPSVVRVGDDYWATATSSEWAPLFPLLHSTNLVDWEIRGHVFPDRLPDWAEAHFWAPEIEYEEGTYYIYYTAKKKGGNLCVGVASATNPAGPYTDLGPLVCQEVGSIDGFAIRDDKGDLYLIWKEDGNSRGLPTPMWGQRMNGARTELLGQPFELFRNEPGSWEGGLVEGAYILRRGEYYYCFYSGDACCGRSCTYGVGVARSKSLRGPWEKHSANPIMKQNEDWRCAGHGSVVTDPQGEHYFLYHAYSTRGGVYTGREGLLDKIYWGADGWPYFVEGAPSTSAQAPHGQNAPDQLAVQEDFSETSLQKGWQWPVARSAAFYTLSASGQEGQLVLQAQPDQLGNLLAQRTTAPAYTVTTSVDKSRLQQGVQAGLAAIGDQENALGISAGAETILAWRVVAGKQETVAQASSPAQGQIQLRLVAEQGNRMALSWSTDGANWQALTNEPLDASYLPPWDRAVRVGLTAKGPAGSTVAFNWFRYEPTPQTTRPQH
ncbi:family 43 glycosylhydrolase [Cesiribacter andamanensis]|uniref:Beta-xylosidase n=1 Tax=Cesiribacter andamanensis AMV16 TaxID=1279009 RepID=M7N1N0_9BACT|nr:family 43 glycosylhydrolase [Cesiribacter andamanensis]EMR01131.1 Beta-xylosidase [Cesiribacter andamanensis AMV16]